MGSGSGTIDRATSDARECIPEVDDESHVKFVTGFPCVRARCPGTLTEGFYAGRDAVLCSVCEQVYYLVADDA